MNPTNHKLIGPESSVVAPTAGPWTRTTDGRLPIVIVGGSTMIAYVGANLTHGPITYLENVANAQLIAAAPSLLEALKASETIMSACLSSRNRMHRELIDMVREAIAQATKGQS